MTRVKWVAPVLIGGAVLAAAVAAPSVPATVTLPVEHLLPISSLASTETAPRWVVLYSMPALALVLWIGFRLAPTRGGERVARWMYRRAPEHVASAEHIGRFGSTYDTIALGVVTLVLGLHAGALASALGADAVAVRIAPAVFGASLLLMGNVMPRLRPNWVAGIRTKRTLADPELWRSTHRAFGSALVLAGLVTIVAGIAAPRFGMVVGLGGIAAALFVGFVASRRVGGTATLAAAAFLGAAAEGVTARGYPKPVELTAPTSVVETAYAFTRDGLTIHGTLAMPRTAVGEVLVVVIVAGSGPTDRNAHGPLINSNAYALLAWGLAEHGIATLRYDKRGIGQTDAPPNADPIRLTPDLFVADVHAAATALAADTRFSKVILLGHSEGAGLSLQAANRGAPVSGVIMASPQGRKFTDLIREQYSRLTDSATVTRIDSALVRLLRGEDPGDIPPIARPLIVSAHRSYLRSFVAYDPPAEARACAGRLPIVQGATDIQTTMDDARALAAAQPRATFAPLEGVDHVLKSLASTDPWEHSTSYKDPHLPLAPSVVPTIARWITAGAAAKEPPRP